MSDYTPPAGILVTPPGESGPEEGESMSAVVPPNPDVLNLEKLSQQLDGPAVATCGVRRVDDPENDSTLQQVTKHYLFPELRRREQVGEEAASYLPLGVRSETPVRAGISMHSCYS